MTVAIRTPKTVHRKTQRITLSLELSFLDAAATEAYIRHRLEKAGGGAFVRFEAAAISRIHRLSGGAPRMINKICELALRCAALEGARQVLALRVVERARRDDVARRAEAALVAAGGEEGPVHSMGLIMVDKVSWNVADLRIDWTDGDPIEECAALWERWRGEMDAYVTRALNPSGAPSYGVPGDL